VAQKRIALLDLLAAISAVAMAIALLVVFVIVPREAVMGDVQRIFYFHVPNAWVGYLALLVAAISSGLFLLRRKPRWDRMAFCSVEIGLVFMTGAIASGSIWAKATWGVWWTWEPRLTTSAVLWAIYSSYLVLRGALEDPGRRARVAAVYCLLGSVSVPINFMAIRWWRTVHPIIFEGGSGNLSPAMLATLIYCLATFTLLYVTLLVFRLGLERAGEQIRRLRRSRIGSSRL
jgi:heme exporter protein C